MTTICPELVGRAAELAVLREHRDAARRGHGGLTVLVGEAGVGKSRLVAAVAEAGDAPVLTGRAVPGVRSAPYRPLAEAMLAASRMLPCLDDPGLRGFGGHLARLVPSWAVHAAADSSPVLMGEAVARLLGALGRGCVLVLEDLHWADPETLDAVEHLADVVTEQPALLLVTTRPEGAATDLVERLSRRAAGATVTVAPLAGGDVDAMVAACLDGAAPEPLRAFVREHSEGNPLLVEELLAGAAAAGELTRDGGRWTCVGPLTPTVPATLRASVGRRMTRLDPGTRRVIGAAALLGRRFDWELLPGIAEVDGRAVVDALRIAVDDQLVVPEGDGFRFRHALTREAVLDDVLPPDRRSLAARAWPAVERAHPGLPGPVCALAAELAEAAGDPEAAAARLVLSAQRALAGGALVTAEATARRARAMAPQAPGAADILVRVLVAGGKAGEALTLGSDLLDGDPAADRRIDLLVLLTRAALTAGEVDHAQQYVEQARAALGPATRRRADHDPADDDPADDDPGSRQAGIDAVAAHVALARGDLASAEALGRAAADATEPAIACEALEATGRAVRITDPPAGDAWFRRAADVAQAHGLVEWHLRSRHELALSAWGRGDTAQLRAVRDLAAGYGAMVTVAVMDLSLADVGLSAFDRAGCLAAARACVEASRRYRLATASVARLWLAGAHALAGDDEAMDAAVAAALAPDPDDPRILGDLYGRVLATRCFVADDLDTLGGHLDTMMEHVARAPAGSSIFPGRLLWAVHHAAVDDDLGAAAVAASVTFARGPATPVFTIWHDIVEAVAAGRRGDAGGAAEHIARFRARWGFRSGLLHGVSMLVARAAIRDGWGEPAVRLRESEAFFAAGGYDRAARRCRILLAEAGAPVPRRGRGASAVPASLRALGVTSREVDVLALVVDGLSNREIGERLFLSPKTVERHVSSLFDRTGVRSRQDLRGVAHAHGMQTG